MSTESLETVVRSGADNSYLFLINHSEEERKYAAKGYELIAGEDVPGIVVIPPGAVRVVRITNPTSN